MPKTVVEEFIATVGIDVDDKQFKEGQSKIKGIATGLASLAAVAGTVVAGVAIAVSKEINELNNLSNSVGANIETVEALGGAIKGIGLDTDNVIDLFEEMNNKLGESKGLEEITPVKESLEILGLQFEKISKLSPEEQFNAIAEAATNLQDQQAAVSAVDILFGGEANKIFGFIRSTGQGYDEFIKGQKALNAQNDRSRAGAIKLAGAFTTFQKVLGNTIKFGVGIVGEFLAPVVETITEMTQAVSGFIATNIETIITKIGSAARILAPILLAVAGAYAFLGAKALISQLILLALPIAIGALLLAFSALIEDIVTFIRFGDGADTLTGRLVAKFPVLGTVLNAVGSIFRSVFEAIPAIIDGAVIAFDFFLDVLASIGGIMAASFDIGLAALNALLSPLETASNLFSSVVGGISNALGLGGDDETDQAGQPRQTNGLFPTNTGATLTPGSGILPQAQLNAGAGIENAITNGGNTSNNVTNDIVINAGSANPAEILDEMETRIARNNAVATSNNNIGALY